MSDTNGTHEPQSQEQAEKVMAAKPLTLEYRAGHGVGGILGESGDGGRFDDLYAHLYDVERMVTHDAVKLPYGRYKAAIANVKFTVEANKEEYATEAHDLLKLIWERHFDSIQKRCDFGWHGAEIDYEIDKGYCHFQGLLDLHPLDCWPLTKRGEYCGFRLKGTMGLLGGQGMPSAGMVDLWGPSKDWPAKGLWLTHDRRWDRFHGRSQLTAAWRPWKRLAARDGAEDIVDGAVYRRGFQGPVMRYPPEDFKKKDGSGIDYESARNETLLMATQAKAGFSVALPNTKQPSGDYVWPSPEWPTSDLANVSVLLDYEGHLEDKIGRAIGVPKELFEAAETGSGFSGRVIPLLGFYADQISNARDVVRSLVDQIVLPILRWNHGDDVWVEATVELELPAALAGTPQGGPGGAQPPTAPAEQPPETPPEEGGEADMGPLAALLPDGGQGAQLSLVGDEDDGWLDPGWYPADDVDGWTQPVGGYELAAPTPGRYQQKVITRGPRAKQSGWYDVVGKKFMPASWTPKPAGTPVPKAPAAKAPSAPKAAAKASGVKGGAKAPPKQAPPAAPAAPADNVKKERIKAAAQKDLADQNHPMNRLKGQIATADFGAGKVATVRPTKDNPLSKSDHEAMDRAHSRVAALLKMNGNEQGAKAQLEAAQYHRGAAGKKGQPAQAAAPVVAPAKPAAAPATPPPVAWRDDREERKFDEALAGRLEGEQKQFVASLGEEGRKAINDYTGADYRAINAAARGQKPPKHYDEADMDRARQTMKRLDAAFESVPELKEPAYVYRGINVPPEAKKAMLAGFERAAKSGQSIGFGGYMSASLDPEATDHFSIQGDHHGGAMSFEIKAKKGIYADPTSVAKGEQEMILPRTAKYRVAGIKDVPWRGGTRKVVQMEQL